MSAAHIGILGARTSAEVQRVRQQLLQRGAQVTVVDLSGFPAIRRGSLSLSALQIGSTNLLDVPVWLHRQLELDQRLSGDGWSQDSDSLQAELEEALVVDREVRSFVASMLWSLQEASMSVRVVNPLEAAALHGKKPLLGARLRQAGLPVPQSLTTTHRDAAQSFVDRWDGHVVCKAAAGYGQVRLASDMLRRLPSEQTSLEGPFVLQQRIRGKSLRAYVVGQSVASCCEVVHGDVVDWRTDMRGLRPVPLTAELKVLLQRTCRAVDFDYAAIDVELDEVGHPFVLDVNPAPLFASYEKESADSVAGPLAAHLIALCEAS